MKHIAFIIFFLLISGCSFVPVFEGDYLRNQTEIANQLEETKGKIAENAGVIHTSLTSEKTVASVITSENAKRMQQWAEEPVEFTAPTQGGDIMNMLMLAGMALTGLGGGGAAIRKISSLKNTVKTVAGMDGESGMAEAKRQGITV